MSKNSTRSVTIHGAEPALTHKGSNLPTMNRRYMIGEGLVHKFSQHPKL